MRVDVRAYRFRIDVFYCKEIRQRREFRRAQTSIFVEKLYNLLITYLLGENEELMILC